MLNAMLKKDAEVKWTNTSEEQLKVFRDLKKSLESPPVLGLQKRGDHWMVDTDNRNYDSGAVLLQDQGKRAEQREKDKMEGKTSRESATEWVIIGYW